MEKQAEFTGAMLTGSQRKTAFALRSNAEKLCREAGVNSVGFLTLTVGDFHCPQHGEQIPESQNFCPACRRQKLWRRMEFRGVNDAREASRRVNNLRGFLLSVFSRAIVVTERHKSGALHFHLLAALASRADIRSGLEFSEIRRRNYRSASPALRDLWRLLREKLPRYGFGRHELLPIKKTGDAVAAYISKYIEKNVCARTAADKRKKLVRYLGWGKSQLKPNEFEWDGARAKAWRGKARDLCGLLQIELPDKPVEPARHVREACCAAAGSIRPKMFDGMAAREAIGPRWAFHVTSLIQTVSDSAVVPAMVWNYTERELCSREMLRFCTERRQIEATYKRFKQFVVCGEIYTAREIREDFPEIAGNILND